MAHARDANRTQDKKQEIIRLVKVTCVEQTKSSWKMVLVISVTCTRKPQTMVWYASPTFAAHYQSYWKMELVKIVMSFKEHRVMIIQYVIHILA